MKYCPACNFSFPDFHHVCDFDGTELASDPKRESLVSEQPSRLRRVIRSPIFLTSLAILLLICSAVLIGYLESGTESIPTVRGQTLALPNSNSIADTRASKKPPVQVNSPTPSKGGSIASLKKLPRSAHATLRRQGSPFRSVGARLNKRITDGDLFESKSQAERSSDSGIRRELEDAGRSSSEVRADRSLQPGSPRAAVVATGSDKSEIATRKENQQPSRTAATPTARDVSNEKSGKLTAFLKTTWKVLKKPFDF